jgi:hypothetical protein
MTGARRPTPPATFAALELAQGKLERAARLLGAAGVVRDAIGLPLQASDRADHDCDLAAVRTALGMREFSRPLGLEGRAMRMEWAVAYAPGERGATGDDAGSRRTRRGERHPGA